jgi:hypothetical protein
MAPRLDDVVLERLELIAVSEGEGAAGDDAAGGRSAHGVRGRPGDPPAGGAGAGDPASSTSASPGARCAVRATLPCGCAIPAEADPPASELLNIFIQSADEWFEPAVGRREVHLGRERRCSRSSRSSQRRAAPLADRAHRAPELLKSVVTERGGERAPDHHRGRARGPGARRLHGGHLRVPDRRPERRHRGDRADADAVRAGDHAGGEHVEHGLGAARAAGAGIAGILTRRARGAWRNGDGDGNGRGHAEAQRDKGRGTATADN